MFPLPEASVRKEAKRDKPDLGGLNGKGNWGLNLADSAGYPAKPPFFQDFPWTDGKRLSRTSARVSDVRP